MSINYIGIMDKLGTKQMILQGPPGTSKTLTAQYTVAQALGYSGEMDRKKISEFLKKHPTRWEMVQFHPSYGYEDFVRGITVETNKENQIVYKTVNKIFGDMCNRADEDKDNQFFLIIDEINRADVATVFGELIYALEYREEPIVIPYALDQEQQENAQKKDSTDQSQTDRTAQENDDKNKSRQLVVPQNLYIIATMNTADKSVGNIDYAIRRRFVFFDCPASEEVLDTYYKTNKSESSSESVLLFKGVQQFLNKNLHGDYRMEDFQIGHTYFMASSEKEAQSASDQKPAYSKQDYKLRYQVLPILREYYIDGILRRSGIEHDDTALSQYLSGRQQLDDEAFKAIKKYFSENGEKT